MVARISTVERLGEYRGYHLLRSWESVPTRRPLCVGYRGAEVARTGPDILHDPAACRDGEQVRYDTEDDLRAAIDATYALPLTALQRDALSLARLSEAESRAPIYAPPGTPM